MILPRSPSSWTRRTIASPGRPSPRPASMTATSFRRSARHESGVGVVLRFGLLYGPDHNSAGNSCPYMTAPPSASLRWRGRADAGARSPLGEWRDAAPAERYSAKAVVAARGTQHTDRDSERATAGCYSDVPDVATALSLSPFCRTGSGAVVLPVPAGSCPARDQRESDYLSMISSK